MLRHIPLADRDGFRAGKVGGLDGRLVVTVGAVTFVDRGGLVWRVERHGGVLRGVIVPRRTERVGTRGPERASED